MQSIPVYLDLPLIGGLLGWIQDTTLLWMVAQISGVKVTIKRLLCGGAIGGLFQFFLLANQVAAGLWNPWILSPAFFFIVIPFLMLLITFYGSNVVNLLRIGGYFYLLSFLLAGFHWGLDSLNGWFLHWKITMFWRFILHLAFIFILGELGWGIVHQKLWEQLCFYPIEIDWDGKHVKLNALLDTGNRLADPFTKIPVVIIELNQVKDLLPIEVARLIEDFNWESENRWDLPTFWLERIRVVPFQGLGQEHGALLGFRPDQITIIRKNEAIISKNVVVAFYNRALSPSNMFQALIPPTVLR